MCEKKIQGVFFMPEFACGADLEVARVGWICYGKRAIAVGDFHSPMTDVGAFILRFEAFKQAVARGVPHWIGNHRTNIKGCRSCWL
jgi:hypothetical protein